MCSHGGLVHGLRGLLQNYLFVTAIILRKLDLRISFLLNLVQLKSPLRNFLFRGYI